MTGRTDRPRTDAGDRAGRRGGCRGAVGAPGGRGRLRDHGPRPGWAGPDMGTGARQPSHASLWRARIPQSAEETGEPGA